jgi:hypothetical protein
MALNNRMRYLTTENNNHQDYYNSTGNWRLTFMEYETTFSNEIESHLTTIQLRKLYYCYYMLYTFLKLI